MGYNRVFEALDVINGGNSPINFFIQQGDMIIKSTGCFRIENSDCVLQGNFSRQRQKFHPKTEEALKVFYDNTPYSLNPNHVMSKYDTQPKAEMEIKILGLCEIVLWSIEVSKKNNKQINFYLHQPENGLHPCYQSKLADLLLFFNKYAESLK